MPLTLRPKDTILDALISSVLSGGIATDVGTISVLRQILEGTAATLADLDYDLWNLLQGWYITSAEGLDLDIRGNDYGLARDAGQAASDPVTYTAVATWVDDIPLPSPQVVQATLADGTQVLYRSLGDLVLTPSGRSISGLAPATTITASVNDTVSLNLDGDGVQTIILGTQTSATAIAASLQAAVRALVPLNPSHQPAYTTFRCDYGVTTAGAYTLRSGTAGMSSTVVVTPAGSHDASGVLKLGLAHGGQESVGMGSLDVPVLCDQVGVIGNVGAGQINQQVSPVAGILSVANALMFSNGREPASDDAYRQDIRSYLLALGRGTQDAIERAVMHTEGADGQRHVMSTQATYGAGNVQVYVCDGRSLTVGAQSDVIQDVQDELDGLGQEPGGWIAAGNVAGVASAMILTLSVDVLVRLGPTPDLVSAQTAITNAIYTALYQWGVGQSVSYMQMAGIIDRTVVEVFDVVFTLPAAWSTTPPSIVGGAIGQKVMPGTITVRVERA